MSDPDREATTPRLTGMWQLYVTAAREYAERLRGIELKLGHAGPHLDTLLARRIHLVRDLAEGYVNSFARWTTHDVPTEQKAREQAEFIQLGVLIRLLIAAYG